jgi:putative transposase
MSSYRRLRVPGATWFFTVNLADRGRTTLTDNIGILRAAYRATVAEHPVFCDAMVVMPDHLHAMWTLPKDDADYSVRWGAIKSRFTMGLREAGRRPGFSPAPIPTELPVVRSGQFAGLKPGLRVGKRETGVWQRRFWEHLVRDEDEYARAVRYVIGNPVKHGFVERAEDWPYSSVHRDRRAGRLDWAA